MSEWIDVVQVGLGPIGLGCVRSVADRGSLRLIAAVDPDRDLVGRSLKELVPGVECSDIRVMQTTDRASPNGRSVVILTTTSSLETFVKHAVPYIEAGYHVASSCEELAFPWNVNPALSRHIDRLARDHSVAVVGTGVNPGFLMDHWPLTATGLCRRVDSIRVERFQDAAHRRRPFQEKIGAGLSVEEFAVRVTQRDIRHVGLTESMQFLANGLGWNLDRTEDVVECVIATADLESPHICVRRGEASGVYQHGRGYVGDREVITMEFRATIGEATIVDRVAIQGDPSTTIEIPGGVQGDTATCNVLVNTAAVLPRAVPGLRTMAELPTPGCSL